MVSTRRASNAKRLATQASDGPIPKKRVAAPRRVDQSTLGDDDGDDRITAATSSSLSLSTPWYHFFTKGDIEYNECMANEWGFERRGDQALFEKLSLEGAQSGLSWLTILRKREAYRRAFHQFDPALVAKMTEENVQELMDQQSDNPRDLIVRHRGKIQSVINNAKCLVQMQVNDESTLKESSFGVLDDVVWSFVHHQPILNRRPLSHLPSTCPESVAMSKELKKRGFKFVGPTTCYSMMQALGLVIDHPMESPEWRMAYERLQNRVGGFQERK